MVFISTISSGKHELVQEGAIEALPHFMVDYNTEIILFCLRILMLVAIDNEGRKRIIDFDNHNILKIVK